MLHYSTFISPPPLVTQYAAFFSRHRPSTKDHLKTPSLCGNNSFVSKNTV